MANTAQLMRLRRKLQDMYDENGAALTASNQAFADDELNDLLNDAVEEVSDGLRTIDSIAGDDLTLAMLVARADGILMLAQDESRRKRWEFNNKVIDDSMTAQNLIAIARELRARYQDHQKRQLKRDIENIVTTPHAASVCTFNTTVPLHMDRNFDNRDTSRNKPRR